MAPVIDHTAYPYIIDTILAECDTLALVAIRATSRAFRARIDAELLPHVVRLTWPVPSTERAWGSLMDINFIGHVRVCDMVDVYIYCVDEDDSDSNQEVPPPPPLLPFVPSAVRALDLVTVESCAGVDDTGAVGSVYDHFDMRAMYPAVRTLRRANYAVWCNVPRSEAHTLVDFVTVHEDLTRSVHGTIEVPSGLDTYVFHLYWFPGWELGHVPSFNLRITHGDVPPAHFVLVLSPYEPSVKPYGPLHFLSEVAVDMLRFLEKGGEVRVVGAHQLPWGVEGDDSEGEDDDSEGEDDDSEGEDDESEGEDDESEGEDDESEGEDDKSDKDDNDYAEAPSQYKKILRKYIARGLSPDELDPLMAKVKWSTMAEWHASLRAKGGDELGGPSAYELQAEWPEYALGERDWALRG